MERRERKKFILEVQIVRKEMEQKYFNEKNSLFDHYCDWNNERNEYKLRINNRLRNVFQRIYFIYKKRKYDKNDFQLLISIIKLLFATCSRHKA